jgi:hypothetical protein
MAVYNITALMTWREQSCRNVFHYETTSELDASQLQEAADEVRAAYVLLDNSTNLANDWILQGINARRVDVADLPGVDVSFTSGSFTGSSAVGGVINQAALIVSGQALTTKPRRVRTYLCGIIEDRLNDAGFWDATILGRADFWRDAMDQISVTGDTLNRVAVAYTGTPPLVTDWNRIETYTNRSNPGVQRRRRIGIGG